MSEEKTLRERVAYVEAYIDRLEKLIKDYEGMEQIYLSYIHEMRKINDNIDSLSLKVDKMYPIVKDVIIVKGYGSFTWTVLRWVGTLTLIMITSWHYMKDSIKHFIHYIFN